MKPQGTGKHSAAFACKRVIRKMTPSISHFLTGVSALRLVKWWRHSLKKAVSHPSAEMLLFHTQPAGRGSSEGLYRGSISWQCGCSVCDRLTCYNHQKTQGNPGFQTSGPKVFTLSLTSLLSEVADSARDLGHWPARHWESLPAIKDGKTWRCSASAKANPVLPAERWKFKPFLLLTHA